MADKGLNFRISGVNNAQQAVNSFVGGLQNVQRTMRQNVPLGHSWNRGLNDNRRAVQQLGFQIGDFATQIAGGQSVMLAFVQQGGQVLQFFGVFGAVAAAALAVFGSLTIAFVKSGGALNQLVPMLGVLGDELSMVVSAISWFGQMFMATLNLVVNNLDVLLIALGIVAGMMAGRLVVATVLASNAFRALTFSILTVGPATTALFVLQSALIAIRGVLMTLLPYALIIGLSILIEWLWRMVDAAGGIGEAFKMAWGIVSSVFSAMSGYARGFLLVIGAVTSGLVEKFVNAFVAVMEKWEDLMNTMIDGWNAFVESVGLESLVLDEYISDWAEKGRDSAEAWREAGVNMANDAGVAFRTARDGLNSAWEVFRKWRQDAKEDPIDVRTLFGGDDGAGAGGGGGGSPLKQLEEEARRIQQIFQQISQSLSQSMLTGFKAVLSGAKSVKDYALESLNAILDKAQDILLSPIFDALGNWLAGTMMGIFGTPTFSFGGPSFAGGGYTGSGSRSGGLDGEGGFMAMLHPNETVVDWNESQPMVRPMDTSRSFNSGAGVAMQASTQPQKIELHVKESPSFASTVEAVAGETSLKVVQRRIEDYDRTQLPKSMRRVSNNGRINS